MDLAVLLFFSMLVITDSLWPGASVKVLIINMIPVCSKAVKFCTSKVFQSSK